MSLHFCCSAWMPLPFLLKLVCLMLVGAVGLCLAAISDGTDSVGREGLMEFLGF